MENYKIKLGLTDLDKANIKAVTFMVEYHLLNTKATEFELNVLYSFEDGEVTFEPKEHEELSELGYTVLKYFENVYSLLILYTIYSSKYRSFENNYLSISYDLTNRRWRFVSKEWNYSHYIKD